MYNSWHMSGHVCGDIVWPAPRALAPRESMTEFSFCFERETKLINRLQLAIHKNTKNIYNGTLCGLYIHLTLVHNWHTVGTSTARTAQN